MTPFAFVVVGFLFLVMYVALRRAADFWKELAERWQQSTWNALTVNRQLLNQIQELNEENKLLHESVFGPCAACRGNPMLKCTCINQFKVVE